MYGNEVFDDMTDDEIWEAFSVSGLYTKYAKRYTVRTMVPDGVPMYFSNTYVRTQDLHPFAEGDFPPFGGEKCRENNNAWGMDLRKN